jgi:hypothetical protein
MTSSTQKLLGSSNLVPVTSSWFLIFSIATTSL